MLLKSIYDQFTNIFNEGAVMSQPIKLLGSANIRAEVGNNHGQLFQKVVCRI